MIKKAKDNKLAQGPHKVVVFGGVLVLGVLIGIGSKLGYDLLTSQKNENNLKTPQAESSQEVTPTPSSSLPANFPPDFPIYPGSELKTSWTVEGDIKEGISILWESQDSPIMVADYYKLMLPQHGWYQESSFESEGTYTISFSRAGAEGFIGITQAEGGLTQISVTVGVELISI
jgi:hypothetical protein